MARDYLSFYRVNRLEEASAKHAELRASLPWMKLAFWRDVKAAARTDPDGFYVGLGKAALEIARDHEVTGEKVAADEGTRHEFAASFAALAAVDVAIEKMAAAGQLTTDEAVKLAALNAEAAFHDLKALTRG